MPTQVNTILNLSSFVIIGSLSILLLVGFILALVIVHQRRMLTHQREMQIADAEKQQATLQALFEGQETERQRLAKDLHDSIGTTLSAVRNNLTQLEQKINILEQPVLPEYNNLLTTTKQMTDETIVEIRQIMNNLMPTSLIDFGLPTALSGLCRKTQASWGIQVGFFTSDKEISLKDEYKLSLFRIAQELFNNSIKYSKAKYIEVKLQKNEDTLLFSFKDNGVGFDLNKVEKKIGSGFGIQNIESRARLMPATYQMTTAPGEGTAVEIILKLN
jgi:signal transduction histidine kinase